jgi:GT2 family glycosyltransferase
VTKPEISVIILTWNALPHLKRFLPSVDRFTPGYAEIIIADNASDDGTAEYVAEHHPRFRHVLFDRNHGFCRGNNLAVAEAAGEYVLLLNNDVEVTEGWLDPLLATLKHEPDVAVVQPKLRAAGRKTHFEYGGAAGGMIDVFGYPFCRGRLFDHLEEDTGQYDDPADIFWASGAAFAVSRELFQQFGGFEESFEFHMEEIDLCWRYLNAGYRIRYCPESIVYHLGGGSLPTGSYRKVFYNYRNNLAMMWRNMTATALITRFWVRFILDYISAIRSLFRGEFVVVKAIVNSHFSFLYRLPGIHRQRRILKKFRKIDREPSAIWKGSVVWSYFVQGRKNYSDL